MIFTCSKHDMQKAISTAIKACGGKVQKSILECLHILAADGKVTIDAFDTVTAIMTSFDADIKEGGVTALPAKLLSDIVSRMGEGEMTFSRTGDSVEIKSAASKVVLQEADATQFPSFPYVDADAFSIPSAALGEMVDGTAFAAYTGEDKPIYTGLLMESDGEMLSVVGIDGFRLAKRSAKIASPAGLRCVVPAKAMRDIAKIAEEGEKIDVSVNKTHFMAETATTKICTRLLPGEYMNYASILPKEIKTRVRLEVKHLKSSLDMVSVLSREDSTNRVCLDIGDSSIKITSASDYGNAADEIPVFIEGDVLRIGFNAKYLLDALRAVDDDSVFIEFESEVRGSVIRPIEGENYLYMVVPAQIRR